MLTYYTQELTQLAHTLYAMYGFLAIGVSLSLCIVIPTLITRPWRN